MSNKPYTHAEFLEQAIGYAVVKTNELAGADVIDEDDIFIVWSCKTLQNSKALLASHAPDGLYFEATLNGDRNEIYFDTYRKVDNNTLTRG